MKNTLKNIRKASFVLLTAIAVVFACGCSKTDEPNNGGNNSGGGNNGGSTYNGHEYVDLGLPSGTLWATCNVGANTPEGYGDYFAWGETAPKTFYDWSTYKYCNGNNETFTKYCYDSNYGYNGFTDNLTSLESIDDAATTNWGAGWRTPSKEEWNELRNNTVQETVFQNGIKGLRFTNANGESLFIPYSGLDWGANQDEVGVHYYYWSSTLANYGNMWASSYASSFSSGSFSSERKNGFSVRPVRSNH